MSEMSAWEIAEGAKINFENFAKMNPHLPIREYPVWIIAMEQLDSVIKILEKEIQNDKME
jgi:hypothetical protein